MFAFGFRCAFGMPHCVNKNGLVRAVKNWQKWLVHPGNCDFVLIKPAARNQMRYQNSHEWKRTIHVKRRIISVIPTKMCNHSNTVQGVRPVAPHIFNRRDVACPVVAHCELIIRYKIQFAQGLFKVGELGFRPFVARQTFPDWLNGKTRHPDARHMRKQKGFSADGINQTMEL